MKFKLTKNALRKIVLQEIKKITEGSDFEDWDPVWGDKKDRPWHAGPDRDRRNLPRTSSKFDARLDPDVPSIDDPPDPEDPEESTPEEEEEGPWGASYPEAFKDLVSWAKQHGYNPSRE